MTLKKLKLKQRKFYKSIESVFCPALKENIYFTSKGFNHLLYDSNHMPRKVSEQYLKLKLFEYVPKLIKESTRIHSIRIFKKGAFYKNRREIITITRYALVGNVRDIGRIRVIIERINSDKYCFLSDMPNKRSKKQKAPLTDAL